MTHSRNPFELHGYEFIGFKDLRIIHRRECANEHCLLGDKAQSFASTSLDNIEGEYHFCTHCFPPFQDSEVARARKHVRNRRNR
jgi:hypothetical protein